MANEQTPTPNQEDPLAQDKLALRKSQAGMRFIAQMTIYNSGDEERLKRFLRESYHEEALMASSPAQRLEHLRSMQAEIGRVRVKQVGAANEYHVVVILEAEKTPGTFYYLEMQVEEDYPHRITRYMQVPLQLAADET